MDARDDRGRDLRLHPRLRDRLAAAAAAGRGRDPVRRGLAGDPARRGRPPPRRRHPGRPARRARRRARTAAGDPATRPPRSGSSCSRRLRCRARRPSPSTASCDWQKWDFYTRPTKPVSVSYVWDSATAGSASRRRRPSSSRSRRRPAALLACDRHSTRGRRTLAQGSGLGAVVGGSVGEPVSCRRSARVRPSWVEQRVTVEALRTSASSAADAPLYFTTPNIGAVHYDPTGLACLGRGLQRGQYLRGLELRAAAEPGRARPLEADVPAGDQRPAGVPRGRARRLDATVRHA